MNLADQTTYTGFLEVTSCGVCSIRFAMPADMLKRCRDTGADFHCPSGHNLVFLKTEAEKLRDQLAAARAREDQLAAKLESSRAMTSHERARVRGLKGAITKAKRRAAAGVCPCCTRTFQNVARHMASQHPGYSVEPIDG